MPDCDLDKALRDLFVAWRSLIRRRANALPDTQERERLDAVYHQVMPIIIRIAEEGATNADVHLAQQLLNQDKK